MESAIAKLPAFRVRREGVDHVGDWYALIGVGEHPGTKFSLTTSDIDRMIDNANLVAKLTGDNVSTCFDRILARRWDTELAARVLH